MIITPLGHTEFLADIANSEGVNVRILVDGWLSDYAVGDLMERSVKVQLDPSKIETIDAVYISHSHTDHFDPYTLIEIYARHHEEQSNPENKKESPHNNQVASHDHDDATRKTQKPILLLPFTLAYLVPLLHEYLADISVEILTPGKPFFLKGIEITGYMFPQSEITNEDDVMMLGIANDHELLFAEIDTLPEEDHLDAQNALHAILTRKPYDMVCYLASRNELPGQLPLLDVPEKKRASHRSQYITTRKDEMYFSYQKYEYEDYADFPNIYTIPGFCRGFIGQGIVYPHILSEEFFATQIFPLDEIASMESDIARECGYDFSQKALIPGRQYRVEHGTIEQGRKECPIGELIKNPPPVIASDTSVLSSRQSSSVLVTNDERSFTGQDFSPAQKQQIRNDGNIAARIYASGPLFPRELSEAETGDAKKRVFEVLNNRFLPYWSASPVASLREALVKNGGMYRVALLLSSRRDPFQNEIGENHAQNLVSEGKSDSSVSLRNDKSVGKIIFEYSTTRSSFIEIPFTENIKTDEDYWLLDVLDFLDGKQELYSNFWHKLDSKKIYRLWTCLGANFCNHDLVEKKYRLHFERAKQGFSVNNFVEEVFSHF